MGDFAFFSAMLLAVGASLEFVVRRIARRAYRAAAGIAVVVVFLLAWIQLAVGIWGNGQDPNYFLKRNDYFYLFPYTFGASELWCAHQPQGD